MAKILIKGGLGYIGARLTEFLSKHHEVSIISRTISPSQKLWLRTRVPNVTFALVGASAGVHDPSFDWVINLATPSAEECLTQFDLARRNCISNINSCSTLLKENPTLRILHFSTFHVYGKKYEGIYEETSALRPVNDYGRLHKEAEEKILSECGTRATIFRCTNIVGAPAHLDLGLQEKLFYLDCCRQAVEKGMIKLKTDGLGFRDFLPMEDVFAAVQLILSKRASISATIANLSSGNSLSIIDFTRQIAKKAGEEQGIIVTVATGLESDSFSEPFTVTNSLLKKLGWSPLGDLFNELSSTFASFRIKKAA